MDDQEVGISVDQNSLLIVHEQPVSVIALTNEISFRGRADINPAPSQSLGNGEINVLCDLGGNCVRHGCCLHEDCERPGANLRVTRRRNMAAARRGFCWDKASIFQSAQQRTARHD